MLIHNQAWITAVFTFAVFAAVQTHFVAAALLNAVHLDKCERCHTTLGTPTFLLYFLLISREQKNQTKTIRSINKIKGAESKHALEVKGLISIWADGLVLFY